MSAVLALQLIEEFNVALGIAILAVSTFTQLVGGYASLGQVLLGFAFGLVLHFYQSFTPVWFRGARSCLTIETGS